MTPPRRRVAVLMGGRSSEHPISVASARSVIDALDPERYEVVAIEIARDGRWSLPSGHVEKSLKPETVPVTGPAALEEANPAPEAAARGTVPVTSRPQLPVPGTSNEIAAALGGVEVVLPILHGPFGEDGRLQGLLEMADVAYVGSDHAASALCMDKDLFKAVMRDQGIPVTRNITLRDGAPAPESPFGYPVFVKPARLGSSVGIAKVEHEEELEPALEAAFEHDALVIVEAFSSGLEVECSVLGNANPEVSQPGEIVLTGADWYDYEAKYTPGGMELVVPARIPDAVAAEVRRIAREAFVRVGCAGLARVDFFVEGERVLLNELNTMPGFTQTSVYPKLWEASGVPFPELCDRLLGLAVAH